MRNGKYDPTDYDWLMDHCSTFNESTETFIQKRIDDNTINEYNVIYPTKAKCFSTNLDILKSHQKYLLAIPVETAGTKPEYKESECPSIL